MAVAPDRPSSADAVSLEASEPEGFTISVPGAQLADLIQINCVNRVRGAFRVSSSGREGFLFFAGGQLVHADVAQVSGLDAVVQMLSWRGGVIEPCITSWPAVSTIDMGADALLLCAAQRLDELPSRGIGNPPDLTTKVVRRVDLPEVQQTTSGASTGGVAPVRPSRAALAPEAESDAQPEGMRRARPTRAQLARLEVAQLRFDGTIQTLRGGASPDLADTAFFSECLASRVGNALGLGACRAIYLEGGQVDGVLVLKGRSLVVTRARASDLAFALQRLGLR